MEENTNVFLGTERVGKLMRGYAVPCIISLLVGALYNIVDQIFIANADYLGSYGNAANTVVFPLTVAALAIAVMVGDGCCAYVSINLGKKDVKTAKKSVGNAVVLVLLASAALTAVYLLLAEPILTMFGGRVNVETFRYAKEYFFYIALGVPFYMFGQALNPIIRADGSPKFAMASTLAGAILNTILDPVFIFVCRWGMMGAAVATVLGQIVTAVLAIWYLCNMRVIRPGKGDFKLSGGLCRRILSLGIDKLPLTDQPCGGNGGHQQHAAQIRRAGPDFRAGAVRTDPDGSGRHCDEVLSDCDLDRCRYGGGVHTDRGLQHGCGEI